MYGEDSFLDGYWEDRLSGYAENYNDQRYFEPDYDPAYDLYGDQDDDDEINWEDEEIGEDD